MNMDELLRAASEDEDRHLQNIRALIADQMKTRFNLERRLIVALRRYEERVDISVRCFLDRFDNPGTPDGEHPAEIKMIQDHAVDIVENIAVDMTDNILEVINATRSAWFVLAHTTNAAFLQRHVNYWPDEASLSWVTNFNCYIKGWLMLLEAIFDNRDELRTLRKRRSK